MKKPFMLSILLLCSLQAFAQTTYPKNTTPLARYEISLESEKNHQFNENQIFSFVYYWFSLHDQHAAIEKSYELLDKNHLMMKYPEMTVRNLKDYTTWYTNVGKNIKNNRHIIENLEVKMLDHHQYQVNVIVNWQAIDKHGQFIDVTATQSWLLVDGDSESHPYIREYRVLNFESNDSSNKIRDEFKELEKENQGILGISALDTNTYKKINYHADKRFPFCSTFKVLLVAAILKQSETRPTFLHEKIFFTQKEINDSGYAPITQRHVKDGMTIEDLCEAAIMYSDNGAANLLIKKLGGLNKVNSFIRLISDNKSRLDRFEPDLNTATPNNLRDTTTPQAIAQDLKKILLEDILAPYQKNLLKTWMEHNTTGDARIRSGVPKSWIVADKTGTGEYGTTNDIAVIYPPKSKPIILVIYFTQPQKEAKSNNEIIAEATKIIFHAFINKK